MALLSPSLFEVIFIPQGIQSGSNLVKELAKFLPSTQMANVLFITVFCSTALKDYVPLISECFSIINTRQRKPLSQPVCLYMDDLPLVNGDAPCGLGGGGGFLH